MLDSLGLESIFDYGVSTAIIIVVMWCGAIPMMRHWVKRSKVRAEMEDERDRKLTTAVEVGTQTLQRLAENGEAMSQAYRGLEAILQSEVEIAKVTRNHIQDIKSRVGEGRVEREAISKAIELVEQLDVVPPPVQRQLADIRMTLKTPD